jgi:hypothetical protein
MPNPSALSGSPLVRLSRPSSLDRAELAAAVLGSRPGSRPASPPPRTVDQLRWQQSLQRAVRNGAGATLNLTVHDLHVALDADAANHSPQLRRMRSPVSLFVEARLEHEVGHTCILAAQPNQVDTDRCCALMGSFEQTFDFAVPSTLRGANVNLHVQLAALTAYAPAWIHAACGGGSDSPRSVAHHVNGAAATVVAAVEINLESLWDQHIECGSSCYEEVRLRARGYDFLLDLTWEFNANAAAPVTNSPERVAARGSGLQPLDESLLWPALAMVVTSGHSLHNAQGKPLKAPRLAVSLGAAEASTHVGDGPDPRWDAHLTFPPGEVGTLRRDKTLLVSFQLLECGDGEPSLIGVAEHTIDLETFDDGRVPMELELPLSTPHALHTGDGLGALGSAHVTIALAAAMPADSSSSNSCVLSDESPAASWPAPVRTVAVTAKQSAPQQAIATAEQHHAPTPFLSQTAWPSAENSFVAAQSATPLLTAGASCDTSVSSVEGPLRRSPSATIPMQLRREPSNPSPALNRRSGNVPPLTTSSRGRLLFDRGNAVAAAVICRDPNRDNEAPSPRGVPPLHTQRRSEERASGGRTSRAPSPATVGDSRSPRVESARGPKQLPSNLPLRLDTPSWWQTVPLSRDGYGADGSPGFLALHDSAVATEKAAKALFDFDLIVTLPLQLPRYSGQELNHQPWVPVGPALDSSHRCFAEMKRVVEHDLASIQPQPSSRQRSRSAESARLRSVPLSRTASVERRSPHAGADDRLRVESRPTMPWYGASPHTNAMALLFRRTHSHEDAPTAPAA